MGTPGSSSSSSQPSTASVAVGWGRGAAVNTNTNRHFVHCNPVPHRHLWYCFIDVTDFFVQTVFVKEKVTGQGFVSFKAQPGGTHSSNVTAGAKGFRAGTVHQEYFGTVGQALLETLVEFVDHLKREGIQFFGAIEGEDRAVVVLCDGDLWFSGGGGERRHAGAPESRDGSSSDAFRKQHMLNAL